MALVWERAAAAEVQVFSGTWPVQLGGNLVPAGATLERTLLWWSARSDFTPNNDAAYIFGGFAIGVYFKFPLDVDPRDPFNAPNAGDALYQEMFSFAYAPPAQILYAPGVSAGFVDTKSRRFNSSAGDASVTVDVGNADVDPVLDPTYFSFHLSILYSTPE